MSTPFSLLVAADFVASRCHQGQVDKAGCPYIEHPRRVAARCRQEHPSEQVVAAALLHDVVEDSAMTIDVLRLLFGVSVAEAIDHLTRRPGEDYFQFIHRVKQDPIAQIVKRYDLQDNMDLSRLSQIGDRDRRRQQKYAQALALLAAE